MFPNDETPNVYWEFEEDKLVCMEILNFSGLYDKDGRYYFEIEQT